jgi:hypothetical protein
VESTRIATGLGGLLVVTAILLGSQLVVWLPGAIS